MIVSDLLIYNYFINPDPAVASLYSRRSYFSYKKTKMSKLYIREIRPAGIYKLVAVTLVTLVMTACAVDEEDTSPIHVRSVATVLGLTGDPTTDRTLPDISDPKAQLGMKLFFTKGLSGDRDTACASCHHPALAGGDGLSLSIGVGAVDPDTGRAGKNSILIWPMAGMVARRFPEMHRPLSTAACGTA